MFVILWHYAVIAFDWKPFQVPSPGLVFEATKENYIQLGKASLLTATAAIAGFLGSMIVGCLIAFLFAQSKLIQRSLFPYAIFSRRSRSSPSRRC